MNEIGNILADSRTMQSTSGNSRTRLGQEEFLELMITQIQNQDPFKPLESGEFLGQMAQFSTVSGISNLQESFATVAGALFSNQALQASALIGRSVMTEGDHVRYTGQPLIGGVQLGSEAQSVGVDILDTSGQRVRHLELGGQAPGLVPVNWDGRDDKGQMMEPGSYRLRAYATRYGDTSAAPSYVVAQVNSVTLGENGQGITLDLGELGQTDLSTIKQIR